MKKCLLVTSFLLFLSLTSYAQELEQEPEISLDDMLINIDKKSLTTPFLYERVMPIAQLASFDSAKDTTDLKHFEQALNELYKSSNESELISYKQLRQRFSPDEELNVVNIGIINADFNTLNYFEKDISKGALKFSGNIFTQINDKPAFLENHILLAAPLKQYAVGSSITYKIHSDFMFEITKGKNIKSLTIKFNDNQSDVLISNGRIIKDEVSINYQESGYKTLTFTAVFFNGSTKTTYSKLHVKTPNQNSYRMDPLVESFTHTSTIPFQGYAETSPIYGELEYRVYYHTNNGNTLRALLKPIVIIDGFDPLDKRKIQDSDSSLPANEHTSIEEFMKYFDSQNNEQELIPLLRNLGYDVILVNHPTYIRGPKTIDGGADYIERNAMNHVTLYQHLNNTVFQNGSTEELVIVGPSMGGQISRYALAYMEKNNIPHNTRLWVSLDSPHLGANIPIGVQSMINLLDYYGDSAAANDFYFNQLKSTAANQQLIEQHKSGSQADYLNGGSPIHQQYYSNLESNGLPNSDGYPQNLRKIAIVNGSLNGLNVGVAGQEDFRIHGFVDQLWWTVKVAEMNTSYMPKVGQTKQVARLWRQFNPTRTLTFNNSNPNGSMDVVPGGLFNSEDQVHASILGQSVGISDWGNGLNLGEVGLALFGIFGDHFESRTNKRIHSFIPTVSALGFKNPNFNWSQKLNRNLVCSNEIPFDSYFGPKNNEKHTSFTETSVNWLLQELAGNPQEPHFPIDSKALTVNETIVCDGESTQVFVNSICKVPGNVSSWSVSSNLNISSTNGNSVIVNSTSDARSQGWVRAHFNNGQSVDKEIWVGKPAKPSYLNGTANPTYGDIVSYGSAPTGGAETYKWYLPGNFGVSPSNTNNPTKWWITQGETEQRVYTLVGPDDGLVVVKGENKCGRGDYKHLAVTVNNDGSGGGVLILTKGMNQEEVRVFPNPSKNNVTVTLNDDSNKISEIVIFDFKMNEVKREKYNDLKHESEIEISRFSSGLYTIMIYTSKGIFTKKIIKQ